MFTPVISRFSTTVETKAQVAKALTEGQTVRLGRWTAAPAPRGGGRIVITQYSEASRNGPLVDPVPFGGACPEVVGADALVNAWLGDW